MPKAPKVKNPGGRDSSYKGSVKNVRDLVSVKDPNVYRELKEGISRFHSTLGVREREVKIATLSPRVIWYYGKFLEQNGEASPADNAE